MSDRWLSLEVGEDLVLDISEDAAAASDSAGTHSDTAPDAVDEELINREALEEVQTAPVPSAVVDEIDVPPAPSPQPAGLADPPPWVPDARETPAPEDPVPSPEPVVPALQAVQQPIVMAQPPPALPFPPVPPRRRPIWTVLGTILVIAGMGAMIVGGWLAVTSGFDWNAMSRNAVDFEEDIALRSASAARSLDSIGADLDAAAAVMGEIAGALDAAASEAGSLGSVAGGGLPEGADGVAALVPELLRLSVALDSAFPALAELGVTDDEGPGSALRDAGHAFLVLAGTDGMFNGSTGVVAEEGFAPLVLTYPLPGFPTTDGFGVYRTYSRTHEGVDINAPFWTPIVAAADGVVVETGWISSGAGYGVILSHGHGWETKYFHMVTPNVPVEPGDPVVAGQEIGYVGDTGNSARAHLHFEVELGGVNVNPESGFIYIGTEAIVGDAGVDTTVSSAAEVIHPSRADEVVSAEPAVVFRDRSLDGTPIVEAGSDVREAQIQVEAVADDTAAHAAALEVRRVDAEDRAMLGGAILGGGLLVVLLGMALMAVTRPRWLATR